MEDNRSKSTEVQPVVDQEMAYVERRIENAEKRLLETLEEIASNADKDLKRIKNMSNGPMFRVDTYKSLFFELLRTEIELNNLRDTQRVVRCIRDWGTPS